MEFLEVFHAMLKLKEIVPGMDWDSSPYGSTIVITLPVGEEIVSMFGQGRQMFS